MGWDGVILTRTGYIHTGFECQEDDQTLNRILKTSPFSDVSALLLLLCDGAAGSSEDMVAGAAGGCGMGS